MAKEALRELREVYDAAAGSLAGRQEPPTRRRRMLKLEAQAAAWMPLLRRLYQQALEAYRAALAERQALDFDDLEAGALSAAARSRAWPPAGRPRLPRCWWMSSRIPTTASARSLQALCGEQPGRLFVVGDARQSIYRFRGADVTVFTGLQRDVQQQAGC